MTTTSRAFAVGDAFPDLPAPDLSPGPQADPHGPGCRCQVCDWNKPFGSRRYMYSHGYGWPSMSNELAGNSSHPHAHLLAEQMPVPEIGMFPVGTWMLPPAQETGAWPPLPHAPAPPPQTPLQATWHRARAALRKVFHGA